MPDVTNWLSGIRDNVQLLDIVMPGSHDAGVSLENAVKVHGLKTEFCACQTGSLYDQAMSGSRFLDCRVFYQAQPPVEEVRAYNLKKKEKAARGGLDVRDWGDQAIDLSERRKLKFGHFFMEKGDKTGMGGELGAYGGGLKDSVNELIQFVTEKTSEFVIIRFSHSGSPTMLNAAMKHWCEKYIPNKWANKIFQSNANAKHNIAQEPLGLLRGKVILTFDGTHGDLDSRIGLHRFYKLEEIQGAVPKTGLTCCGEYVRTSNLKEVVNQAKVDSRSHLQHTRNHLHFVYYQQTQMLASIQEANTQANKKSFTGKEKQFSGGARTNLPGFLAQMQQLSGFSPVPSAVNVVSHDFVDANTSRQIVSLNPGYQW